jgi:DNA-binding XRE family transcriptional regulator
VKQAILVLERNGRRRQAAGGRGDGVEDREHEETAAAVGRAERGADHARVRPWRSAVVGGCSGGQVRAAAHWYRRAMAGRPEPFSAAVSAMLDEARGWRLAEMRQRRGMTQEQVAAWMGVSVARVSQIESGDAFTQDVLNRFVTALGGTLKLIAEFGDEQLKIA